MKLLEKIKMGKKGVVQGGMKIAFALIGVFIGITIAASLIPTVLTSITNISNSGVALPVLWVTVLPLLLAVGLFVAFHKQFKF